MEKVYQIFVSSTYADLADERRRVSETLAKAGYIPSGMELFPATDQQQLDFIKRVIDRCDYYVVIVGGRYGSLADDNISFTEKEYEYALERKIPILAFLHKNPEKIEVGKTDTNEEQARRLAAFRERLSRSRIVDFWVDPHELCTKVVIAVAQAINLSPGVGWVRGDLAIDPKVVQELELVRIENEELKKKLTILEMNEITFPADLLGPEDPIEFEILSSGKISSAQMLGSGQIKIRKYDPIPAKWRLKDLFNFVADQVIAEQLEGLIGMTIVAEYVENNAGTFENDRDYSLSDADLVKIRSQLEALGLIRAKSSRNGIYWSITDQGSNYISRLRAVRRKQVEANGAGG
jgi:hypothetical protein